MRIHRITDIQDPTEPLALISSWQMFNLFLLSQRACQYVKALWNTNSLIPWNSLKKMKRRQRRMEVSRINGRVIPKIMFNFLCPVTSGVHEKSRVHDSMTWCHVARVGRVEIEEQARVKGVSRSDEQGLLFRALKHHLGCNITQKTLFFSSSSFLLLLRFNSPTIKFILLKRTVDGMVFFSSQVFSSPIPLNPMKFPVLGSLYMFKVKLHAVVWDYV